MKGPVIKLIAEWTERAVEHPAHLSIAAIDEDEIDLLVCEKAIDGFSNAAQITMPRAEFGALAFAYVREELARRLGAPPSGGRLMISFVSDGYHLVVSPDDADAGHA